MVQDHFPRIKQLWDRREQLQQADWAELYRRVDDALSSYRPREAAALADSTRDLRHLFFVERVMHARGANGPEHAGALRLYFRRFLLDLLDQRELPPPEDALDKLCNTTDHASAGAILHDYGVTPEQAATAAATFISTLSDDMLLLLRHCGCGGMPLRELAGQIASAHYHSGKLGLVHQQAGKANSTAAQTTLPAHRRTLLGRWVAATLGLEADLQARDITAAQIILDILCAIALHDYPAQSKGAPTA